MVRIYYYSGYFWVCIVENFIKVICLLAPGKGKKVPIYGYSSNYVFPCVTVVYFVLSDAVWIPKCLSTSFWSPTCVPNQGGTWHASGAFCTEELQGQYRVLGPVLPVNVQNRYSICATNPTLKHSGMFCLA